MKSIKLALIYGFLVWVIPFIVAFLIFPLRTSDRPFFESIMPVAVTLATVLFAVLYFQKVTVNFLKEGIFLGIIFFVVSIVIDLLIFSKGPMAMPLAAYIKDIGFYLFAYSRDHDWDWLRSLNLLSSPSRSCQLVLEP